MPEEARRAATLLPGISPETFDEELALLRDRVGHATAIIAGAAFLLAIALTAAGRLEALLPLTFVLGWLNLAGL